jgi:4-hydroxyacetophenone monooxygenase
MYSLSTDLKDDWPRTYEFQPGILTYIHQLVSKYDLTSHINYNTKVIAAEWQTDRQLYTITIQDTSSGVRTITQAHILISAHGILHIPKMPSIPGLDIFKGRLFHSSQWDTSLDLSGKRVAIIGNGSSAYVVFSFPPWRFGHLKNKTGHKSSPTS